MVLALRVFVASGSKYLMLRVFGLTAGFGVFRLGFRVLGIAAHDLLLVIIYVLKVYWERSWTQHTAGYDCFATRRHELQRPHRRDSGITANFPV